MESNLELTVMHHTGDGFAVDIVSFVAKRNKLFAVAISILGFLRAAVLGRF
jgi:hypothetical protein